MKSEDKLVAIVILAFAIIAIGGVWGAVDREAHKPTIDCSKCQP